MFNFRAIIFLLFISSVSAADDPADVCTTFQVPATPCNKPQLTIQKGEGSFNKCPGEAATEAAKTAPTVTFTAAVDEKSYLLVMVKQETTNFQALWIKSDMKAADLKTGATSGTESLAYQAPTSADAAPQKYQFFLFEQSASLAGNTDLSAEIEKVKKTRTAWDLAAFIKKPGICKTFVAAYEYSITATKGPDTATEQTTKASATTKAPGKVPNAAAFSCRSLFIISFSLVLTFII
ncbi:hypothetical protein HELRODRAFT_191853 [Helobdella robusta]|uniref:Reelin domain-containing protein n=1 Tax=Helobdella robusta TaxID=6412 RepID=T1FTC9_HELRO|nr:hypothetical protein HELRODRAFT_191853 [Helobdella robusta]ESO03524.1 hypothetical protein HELRODRAFT_191853 [Helobdella robusta]